MKAKDYLRQLQKLDKLIENKLAEKEQWKAMATSTTQQLTADRVQTSGNPQKMADAVCKIIEIEGVSKRCIQLDAPIPNQRELIWSEDKLSAEGHSTITLNSTKQNLTLKFEFRLTYPENKEMLGGSGMTVTAVNYGDDCIEREDHIYNNYAFYFDISDLIK